MDRFCLRVWWIFLFLGIGLSRGASQEYCVLVGQILDEKSNQPLSFVHIGIPAKGVGTVSNGWGSFKINFPCGWEKEKLVISHIGYEEQGYDLKNLGKDSLIIRLRPNPMDLGQVEVLMTQEPLEQICRKAIRRLKENYPTQLHAFQAFFRESKINAEDRIYTRLLEAAVRIQDRGIQTSTDQVRIGISQFRKSDDLTVYHDSRYRVLKESQSQNQLYELFTWNPIRGHFTRPESFRRVMGLDGLLLESTELSLQAVKHLGLEKIYVIAYSGIAKKGTIHISATDYGIHRLEHTLDISPFLERNRIKLSPGYANRHYIPEYGINSFSVSFQKIEDKYYPRLIRQIYWEDEVWSSKGADLTGRSYTIRTLLVNQVYAHRKDFERISKRDFLPRDQDLYDLSYPYRPSFWKDYNYLLLRPLDQRVRKDLERFGDLEEQFRRNSTH